MRPRTFRSLAATLVSAALAATPAAAQQSVGVSADYLGYSFEGGLGASAAQLFMVPVAVRIPVGPSLRLDAYSAWAQGRVEQDGFTYDLSGVVDTRVKATWQATPWAMLGVGAGLPTGDAQHTAEEAVVSSVLAADLLGFREATWGVGTQITSSVATAVRAGSFGIGLAAAYSLNGEFEPRTEQDLTYQPGNETRVRLGIDRNIGTNTLTAGATFTTYTEDTYSHNLFQAGNRLRFDAAYAFRAGAGVWTVYAANLWRENGENTVAITDQADAIVGDTTLATASQNLLVAGLVGAISVGGAYQFRPMIDLKLQSREEADGRNEGSGWIVAAGGDFPVRLFGTYDVFPKARVLFGAIEDATGLDRQVLGGEFSATVRWGF